MCKCNVTWPNTAAWIRREEKFNGMMVPLPNFPSKVHVSVHSTQISSEVCHWMRFSFSCTDFPTLRDRGCSIGWLEVSTVLCCSSAYAVNWSSCVHIDVSPFLSCYCAIHQQNWHKKKSAVQGVNYFYAIILWLYLSCCVVEEACYDISRIGIFTGWCEIKRFVKKAVWI